MSRDQRHAYMRIQMACQTLNDPDAMPRELASARVSFYRGFRALAAAYGHDQDLTRAAVAISAFTIARMPQRQACPPDVEG